MDFLITEATARKLRQKHNVSEREVIECFGTRKKTALIDNREEHRTDPPTRWFIAETDAGRRLKVLYIRLSPTEVVIRTAYEPNADEERVYSEKARGLDL